MVMRFIKKKIHCFCYINCFIFGVNVFGINKEEKEKPLCLKSLHESLRIKAGNVNMMIHKLFINCLVQPPCPAASLAL